MLGFNKKNWNLIYRPASNLTAICHNRPDIKLWLNNEKLMNSLALKKYTTIWGMGVLEDLQGGLSPPSAPSSYGPDTQTKNHTKIFIYKWVGAILLLHSFSRNGYYGKWHKCSSNSKSTITFLFLYINKFCKKF